MPLKNRLLKPEPSGHFPLARTAGCGVRGGGGGCIEEGCVPQCGKSTAAAAVAVAVKAAAGATLAATHFQLF